MFLHFASCSAVISLATLLTTAQSSNAQYDSQAIAGSPFGVARVSLPIDDDDRRVWASEGFQIQDAEGRVFYPTFSQGTALRFLGELSGQPGTQRASKVDAFFLFRGDEPFDIVVETARAHRVSIKPTQPRRRLAAQRVWRSWWREYSAMARIQEQRSSYPPVVETYLTSMLAGRLGLEPPLMTRFKEKEQGELQATVDLLLGVERLRYDVMQQSMLSVDGFNQELTIDLPEDIDWRLPADADGDSDEIEPMARHVPEECLYVRFGSWQNQVWLKTFAEREGAELARLVSLRSFDNLAGDRLQEQLAIQDSKFVDLFGGNLIVDVALIGMDAFLREGATMGVILQARNSLLGPGISRQRSALQQRYADQGATIEKVTIDGAEVSLLSTPDNQLRSFYVVDGKFHLMTNSETLVRRFLGAGRGEAALANSAEFRLARAEFPLERNDSIFIYLSSAFFRHLLTPRYQIEMQRRLQSVTDIEMLLLARAVARAEGMNPEDLSEMIDAKLLPRGFGRRPDGSGPTWVNDELVDSLRGKRGYFLPVADVSVTKVTEQELVDYQRRADYFAQQWQRLDPLVVALNRPDDPSESPQVLEFEARLQPFGEEKYGWLFSLLGPPMQEVVRVRDQEVVTLQASVKGGLLMPGTAPHQLFVTLNDDRPLPLEKPADLWSGLDMIRTAPGYLGAWPKPGFLDMLPIGLGAEPDSGGFTSSLLGLFRWQGDGFSLLSFDRQRLVAASESLQVEQAETPAHMHLHVGDLGNSQLRPWLEQLTYWRAREATLGNVRLLNQVVRQLQVAPQEARDTAEDLLDVRLLCPLDGEYGLVQPEGLSPRWRSSAIDPSVSTDAVEVPRQPLSVLAGADVRLLKTPDRFAVWGKLGIRPPEEPLEEIR